MLKDKEIINNYADALLDVRKQLEQSQWDVEFLKGEITHLKEFMKYNNEEFEKAKETINALRCMVTTQLHEES